MEVIDEHKASIIKKYPTEVLILILCFAFSCVTGWLYHTDSKVDALQVEMKTYLHEDRKVLIETLDKTNETMEKTNTIIENFNKK